MCVCEYRNGFFPGVKTNNLASVGHNFFLMPSARVLLDFRIGKTLTVWKGIFQLTRCTDI